MPWHRFAEPDAIVLERQKETHLLVAFRLSSE